MKQVPAKQIYLLLVIIVGIIALSVYSTYALFTFENTTGDIVSIHIPKSLTISENVYEYQQIKIAPNQVATTDIDVYNAFEYETCYSVWYKVLGTTEEQSKVQIFEQNDKTLSSTGTIGPNEHLRVKIVIINDNDKEIKINLGTIGSSKENAQCSLNLSSDKNMISVVYSDINLLTTTLLNDVENKKQEEENYIIYDKKDSNIIIEKEQKMYMSNEFTYTNEIFSLTNGVYATIEEYITIKTEEEKNKILEENPEIIPEEIIVDINLENNYFCMDNNECNTLYQITKIEQTEEGYIINYKKFIGYLSGENGLRKVNEKDYFYYGDNPNNYIYYNCKNMDDSSSCELWRIIGLIYNNETNNYNIKIVRNESIGKYQYDYKMLDEENKSSNDWNESILNKFLNEEYKLNSGDQYLEMIPQKLEIIKNLETPIDKMKSEIITNSKINLLTLSDYLLASTCYKNQINEYDDNCFKNNWLNNIEVSNEWTMTSKEIEIPIIEEETIIEEEPQEEDVLIDETTNDEIVEENQEQLEELSETNQYVINYVYSVNNNIQESDVTEELSVRPVVYLKSRMLLIEGNGTFSSPYMVK